jgi:VanZ family protein
MFFNKNLPAIIWTLIIFLLCSMPGNSIPKIEWLALLSFDKFVHASMFFILQLLWMRGFFMQVTFPALKVHYKIIPFLFCVTYGALLELMQNSFFSERTGDLLDFVANTIGCIVAFFIFDKLKNTLRIS